jgi:hypothetical protein
MDTDKSDHVTCGEKLNVVYLLLLNSIANQSENAIEPAYRKYRKPGIGLDLVVAAHRDIDQHLALPGGVVVARLKGSSSRRLHKQRFPEVIAKLWGDNLWSPSYFAASCGGAPIAVVRQYIENQRRASTQP